MASGLAAWRAVIGANYNRYRPPTVEKDSSTAAQALGTDGTNCGIAQGQRRTWYQRLTPMLGSYGVNLVTD